MTGILDYINHIENGNVLYQDGIVVRKLKIICDVEITYITENEYSVTTYYDFDTFSKHVKLHDDNQERLEKYDDIKKLINLDSILLLTDDRYATIFEITDDGFMIQFKHNHEIIDINPYNIDIIYKII